MDVVRNDIRQAIGKEHDHAVMEHGLCGTWHEKYSLILEEVEEAMEEGDAIEEQMRLLWAAIRRDDYENAARFAARIKQSAENLAIEAVQIAAMARKEVKE